MSRFFTIIRLSDSKIPFYFCIINSACKCIFLAAVLMFCLDPIVYDFVEGEVIQSLRVTLKCGKIEELNISLAVVTDNTSFGSTATGILYLYGHLPYQLLRYVQVASH